MEIKWYWLAEQLGLMADISHQYDSGIHYTVSAKADSVFMALFLCLIPVLFLLGFLLRFFLCRSRQERIAQLILRCGIGLLLVYALLLATGIGPYIQFYPQSAGFIDLSLLEHIISGTYCALLALSLFLGGRLGRFLSRRLGPK